MAANTAVRGSFSPFLPVSFFFSVTLTRRIDIINGNQLYLFTFTRLGYRRKRRNWNTRLSATSRKRGKEEEKKNEREELLLGELSGACTRRKTNKRPTSTGDIDRGVCEIVTLVRTTAPTNRSGGGGGRSARPVRKKRTRDYDCYVNRARCNCTPSSRLIIILDVSRARARATRCVVSRMEIKCAA